MKKKLVKVKIGWDMFGRVGEQLGEPIFCGQLWTPVLWHGFGCKDPELYKTAGLEIIEENP